MQTKPGTGHAPAPIGPMSSTNRRLALREQMLIDISAHTAPANINVPVQITAAAWFECGAEHADVGWVGASELAHAIIMAVRSAHDRLAARGGLGGSQHMAFVFYQPATTSVVPMVFSVSASDEPGQSAIATIALPFEDWSTQSFA